MRNIISNAFSINMLPAWYGKLNMEFIPINMTDIPTDVYSVIGHAETAAVVSDLLGFEVKYNRETYTFDFEDTLYVAQYRGPRLAEGATKLPEDANILFWKVQVVN